MDLGRVLTRVQIEAISGLITRVEAQTRVPSLLLLRTVILMVKRSDDMRGGVTNIRGIKHLPYLELMDRKACGLCFRCGKRFHPLHQCTDKQLCLVILGEGEMINEEDEVIAIEPKEEEEETAPECRTLGVFGVTKLWKLLTTMRFEGKVKGIGVQVLADNGASHCFIDSKVATTLNLMVELGV